MRQQVWWIWAQMTYVKSLQLTWAAGWCVHDECEMGVLCLRKGKRIRDIVLIVRFMWKFMPNGAGTIYGAQKTQTTNLGRWAKKKLATMIPVFFTKMQIALFKNIVKWTNVPVSKIFLLKLKLDRCNRHPKKHTKYCRGNVCSFKWPEIDHNRKAANNVNSGNGFLYFTDGNLQFSQIRHYFAFRIITINFLVIWNLFGSKQNSMSKYKAKKKLQLIPNAFKLNDLCEFVFSVPFSVRLLFASFIHRK